MTRRRKKEAPSRDKPAKKAAAKPKPGTKPKAPTPAAPVEAPWEVPPHERPAADRQKGSPRRRPRLPFTPLPRPRSLRGRLSRARSRHRRLLDLQRVQAKYRPRTCLRQSARRENQAPRRLRHRDATKRDRRRVVRKATLQCAEGITRGERTRRGRDQRVHENPERRREER